jgi:hypothetical protein
MSFVVTGALTVTTYARIPVTRIDVADVIVSPIAEDRVQFSVVRFTPTPDSLGGVNDVATSELLIPRIAPPPPILTSTVSNGWLTSNVATLTTQLPHGMLIGNTVKVSGLVPSTLVPLQGEYEITAVPSPTTLSYDKTNANIGSSGTPIVATAGKVETVNVPEDVADYPGTTDEERTHDGLWVKAVGGLPNS